MSKELGARISELLQKQGVSQKELAKRIGVTEAAMSRYISGTREPKPDVIAKPDGTFHEMRFYNEHHYLIMEIAYHPEPNLNNGNRTENILHVHEYPQQDNFRVRPAHRITKQEYEKYKKFFKGVPKIEKW
mgnify:FL=1